MALSDVGTLAWARRSGGRISSRDRMEILRQGIVLKWRKWRAQNAAAAPFPADLAAIVVPDSAAARRAELELAETSPDYLVNHGYRCYIWAALLAQARGLRFDPELMYVAALLHDVGLTAAGDMGTECFAVDGALYMEGFGARAGWSVQRAERAAEALSLHINPLVPPHHGAEAHLLNAATVLDVAGLGKGVLPVPVRQEVLGRYPRLNLAREIASDVREQAEIRPCCRMHYLVRKFGFAELIEHAGRRDADASPVHAAHSATPSRS